MQTSDQPPKAAPADTDPGEVRCELEKILASRAFANAPRAQQFLRFVIEETLAGRAGGIRESVVAARVFNLGGSFDRRKNSIVRAEATHVRRRLRDYYTAAGASDSLIVDLPRGGYAPLIRIVARGPGGPGSAPWRRLAALVNLFRPDLGTRRD